MSDTDIHSCGYYCDRHACIVAQRNELRDKLFEGQAVKTYSGGKPNYTQPIEPEPVAWMHDQKVGFNVPLYTAPPKKEWVGLTSEELEFYTEELGQGELGRGVLRAVVDFLKEKNSTSEGSIQISDNKEAESARAWVGLTDDEIAQLMFKCDVIVTGPTQFEFAQAIEAKLKEKNHG